MINLGIGQLTAIEVDPLEYVSIAARAGLDTVSLFVNPMGSIQGSCLTTPETSGAMLKQLMTNGVKLANIECFPLAPGLDVNGYRSHIELGASLGASSATVLLYDADESRVIDNLSRVCEIAAESGLRVGVEFMPLAPGWKTLEETVTLVEKVNKPNLGIGIDLLHLIRSGGTPEAVAATDPRYIAYAQLCDSNDLSVTEDYADEASHHRLTPGDGKFPIVAFLQALPRGTPLELEVPQKSAVPARERVEAIVSATRRQIAKAGL